MVKTQALFGVILCGGKSRRMGYDKSLLCYHENVQQREFLRQILSTIKGIQCVVFSLNQNQSRDNYYRDKTVVVDNEPDAGPMGGILSVMKTYTDCSVLAVACDMPRITAETLRVLTENRDINKFATVYRVNEYLQPLTAIYENRAIETFKESMKQGKRGLRNILKNQNIKVIEGEPQFFTNINSHDELEI